ncbi:hypothetical protein ACFY65_17960 [Streptomyces cellulosae]
MPGDTVRPRRRTGAGIAVVLVLVLGAVLVTGRSDGDGGSGEGCPPRTVVSWAPEPRLTSAFARYGDDDTRTDDWTGGDGTHSVRLPDGRLLWLFSDTFLGRVHRPPNPSRDGRLVLSHDVNWLETSAAAAMLSRNVSLYRPRFVTVRLGPPRRPPGGGPWSGAWR